MTLLADNGFNAIWNEFCEFDVANPAFALLRFVIQDEDSFGESNFIGQATYPVRFFSFQTFNIFENYYFLQVTCLRTGYRSIILKNGYSEDLELASLLIHINIRNPLVSRIYFLYFFYYSYNV